MTKAIFHRSAEMDWVPASKVPEVYVGGSDYHGQELAWVKVLSDRRAEGEGFAYLLKLCPPEGKLINIVAVARSDEHVWVLEGGFCDRRGHQRVFPGDYVLNPAGHPHGPFCMEETVVLVVCTGEPDETREFTVLDVPATTGPEDD